MPKPQGWHPHPQKLPYSYHCIAGTMSAHAYSLLPALIQPLIPHDATKVRMDNPQKHAYRHTTTGGPEHNGAFIHMLSPVVRLCGVLLASSPLV